MAEDGASGGQLWEVTDLLMVQGRNWGGENGGIDNVRPSIDSKRKKALPGETKDR